MPSVICLSMQTCFEPLLMQPRAHGLAPSPHVRPSPPAPTPAPIGLPLLSSDHILPSAPSYWDDVAIDHVACQDKGSYVHPLMRRSPSVLSEKSLEMCTESLGSETGSVDFLGDEDEAEIYPFFLSDQCHDFPVLKSRKGDRERPGDYPPPLKSMTGSAIVRMRPCRGEGRLVLQAVIVSSYHNSFLVERGEGRLRVSLLLEAEATEQDGYMERAGEGHEYRAKEEQEGEEEGNEMGKEEERFAGGGPGGQPPCRCKEGEGLLNWKPCWVATQ
ncbi:hypothetical protein MLD38_031809 [Melastoma candidum]|uniref:Uncharacterized protein n=1 Tax=Melastoma candidum TaxID=119954 RepID=A0ACB9MRZ6_9MYRT|nr:hypothetical protein MLD38_031809 [Melastoma candidum]